MFTKRKSKKKNPTNFWKLQLLFRCLNQKCNNFFYSIVSIAFKIIVHI